MQSADRPLRIHWIVNHVHGSRDSGFQSSLASNRYRAIWPAQQLEAAGDQVEFISAAEWHWTGSHRSDVVIIGKLVASKQGADGDAALKQAGQHVMATAGAAIADGAALIADFNDDWFEHPVHGEYWRRLAQMVHLCVAGSEAMAATLRRFTPRPIVTVGDILGSPHGEPRVFRRASAVARALGRLLPGNSTPRLRMAWYGHPSNWPAMQAWAHRLATIRARQSFLISVVTHPTPSIDTAIADFNAQQAPNALIELVPWSEANQWGVVQNADIVLVPTDPGDPKKAVKTSNRVADALHAGRYVIASPLPSYAIYSEGAALVDDPVAALLRYLARPDHAARTIARGQALAIQHCSAPAVGAQWHNALVASRQHASVQASAAQLAAEPVPIPTAAFGSPPPSTSPLRLNLGCGDKILPNYVNVDVVASRAGKVPDVLCDLQDLSVFASSSVDEVLAVHVVEHFWRWDVEAILREWVRVLKPGGQMILECPNLISACEAFLKDPDRGSLPTKEGQRTMWVFYGDPAWQDPYMIHRWGYTPASLGSLMSSVGLCNVRQAAAQFKLREPRDMRMVGEKPRVPQGS